MVSDGATAMPLSNGAYFLQCPHPTEAQRSCQRNDSHEAASSAPREALTAGGLCKRPTRSKEPEDNGRSAYRAPPHCFSRSRNLHSASRRLVWVADVRCGTATHSTSARSEFSTAPLKLPWVRSSTSLASAEVTVVSKPRTVADATVSLISGGEFRYRRMTTTETSKGMFKTVRISSRCSTSRVFTRKHMCTRKTCLGRSGWVSVIRERAFFIFPSPSLTSDFNSSQALTSHCVSVWTSSRVSSDPVLLSLQHISSYVPHPSIKLIATNSTQANNDPLSGLELRLILAYEEDEETQEGHWSGQVE